MSSQSNTPVSPGQIRWTPFADAINQFEGVIGLGCIVVRLLQILRIKNELLAIALERISQLERDLRTARQRHANLVEELRAVRRSAA
jgi:hypothetical protein